MGVTNIEQGISKEEGLNGVRFMHDLNIANMKRRPKAWRFFNFALNYCEVFQRKLGPLGGRSALKNLGHVSTPC